MRIVSLCPSLTELVFDLGLGDHLVGVTRFCVHPAEGVERIEKVGGTKSAKIDRILQIAPDLVLLNREENRSEDAERLEAAGIRCHTSFPKTVADAAHMVRAIGVELAGLLATTRDAASEAPARVAARAERIAFEIDERSHRVRAANRDCPPLGFAYLIWRRPLMTVSDDTFVGALLSLPGGRNVFGDHPKRYPVIDARELARAAPDVVFLSTEPFPFRDEHIAEVSRHTALAPEIFRIVDGELLSWHGSRTPAGVDYAERVIRDARHIAR